MRVASLFVGWDIPPLPDEQAVFGRKTLVERQRALQYIRILLLHITTLEQCLRLPGP